MISKSEKGLGINGMTKLLIACIADAILLCSGHAFNVMPLVVAALAGYIYLVLRNGMEHFFAITFFYISWMNLMRLDVDSFSIYTLTLIVMFLYQVVLQLRPGAERKIKEDTTFFSLLMLFYGLAVTLIGSGMIDVSHLTNLSMFVMVPILGWWSHEKQDFRECAVFCAAGVILSAMCSLVFQNSAGMAEFIKIARTDVVNAYRICGFTGDGNRLGAQALTAIACILAVQLKESGKNMYQYLLLLVLLLVCGILTVSKMFLFVAGFLMLLWLPVFMSKGGAPVRKIAACFIVLTIIIGILASGVLNNQIDIYMRRFRIVTNATTLTTNRTDIWAMYIGYLQNHVETLLFGKGVMCEYLYFTPMRMRMHMHNVLLELVYKLGLFGTLLAAKWIKTIAQWNGKRQGKGIRGLRIPKLIVLVGCFASWFALPVMDFDEFYYVILLAALAFEYINHSFVRETENETNIRQNTVSDVG